MVEHFTSCVTQYTLTGERNMKNRKPFRTKDRKAMAKRDATKRADGAFRSSVPVDYHK